MTRKRRKPERKDPVHFRTHPDVGIRCGTCGHAIGRLIRYPGLSDEAAAWTVRPSVDREIVQLNPDDAHDSVAVRCPWCKGSGAVTGADLARAEALRRVELREQSITVDVTTP